MQRRHSPKSTFKPQLELLEQRDNPSFLLAGNAVPQLAQPLDAIVADMKTTANDLTQAINSGFNANSSTARNQFYTVAVSDYQRLLTEQHAIQATSSADQTFINTVAFAEFGAGDAQDLVVLMIGKNFGLQPLKPLTDAVDQANGIMSGPGVKRAVGDMQIFTLNGLPIIAYTQAPQF